MKPLELSSNVQYITIYVFQMCKIYNNYLRVQQSSKEHHKFMDKSFSLTSSTDNQVSNYLINHSCDNINKSFNDTYYGYQYENQVNPLKPSYIKTQENKEKKGISKFIMYQHKKAFFKVKFQDKNYYTKIMQMTLNKQEYKTLQQIDTFEQLLQTFKESIRNEQYDIFVASDDMLRVKWWIQQEDVYTNQEERFYFDIGSSQR